MNRITILNTEWNNKNGFVFELIHLDLYSTNIEVSLIGLYFSRRFLYVDIIWKRIKIFDKTLAH